MKPLVSIIIPVYQVEKYLDRCISSVLAQSHQELEVILVDDGSADRCPEMCDQWKARDSRVVVIHQENGGLSKARNVGLKIAKGEIIGFVDSDDWIEPNMVELLLAALLETGADIAVGGIKTFTDDSEDVVYTQPKPFVRKLYIAEEALRRLLLFVKGFICSGVWNKLYRRSILLNNTFPEGKLHEDVLWTARAIGNAKTIVSINQICYHYLLRSDSLSHDTRQKVKLIYDELEMNEQRLEYIHEHYPALEKIAVMRHHNFCCRGYLGFYSKFRHLDPDGKIRDELYQHFCKYRPRIFWDIRDIPKNITRILFWLYPNFIGRIYSICKKS